VATDEDLIKYGWDRDLWCVTCAVPRLCGLLTCAPCPRPTHPPPPPPYCRFHVDKLSSAHVYLRLPPGMVWDALPEALLTDCAQLVKENSIEGARRGPSRPRPRCTHRARAQGVRRTTSQCVTRLGPTCARRATWMSAKSASTIASWCVGERWRGAIGAEGADRARVVPCACACVCVWRMTHRACGPGQASDGGEA
jgi:hypothetical protein